MGRGRNPQTLVIEGLASTMQQAATPEAIADLPVLGLAIDQGSDMWAVTFFCLNVLHMNLCVLFDSSHAVWNDCRLAIQSTPGLNMQMLMILLILNLNVGAFESANWFNQVREGSAHFVAH